MKTDKDTLEWIGSVMGGSEAIEVRSVGNGPYGLMEIIKCGVQEERHWRYIGFPTAQAAKDFSIFLVSAKANRLPKVKKNSSEYEKQKESIIEHSREHVNWQVFCINAAIPNELLDNLIGK